MLDRAKTSRETSAIDLAGNQTTVTIGLWMQNIMPFIRSNVPNGWHRDVTEDDDQRHLQFWFNGRTIFSESGSGADAVANLTDRAAFRIIETTQPYAAAVSLFARDKWGDARQDR